MTGQESAAINLELKSTTDVPTLHVLGYVKLPDGSWKQKASTIRRYPEQGP